MLRRVTTVVTPVVRAHNLNSACAASTVIAKIQKAVDDLPLREYALYKEKNFRLSPLQMMKRANEHANALLNHRFKSGETLAVWLPDDCPEKHVIFLAAAKANFKIVDINPKVTNIYKIREALTHANPKAIYFFPKIGKIDYMKLLRKCIPEYFYFDDTRGQMFHSKHYPNLRYFIHLGPGVELGALAFQELFFPNPTINYVDKLNDQIHDSFPLYQRINRKEDGDLEVLGPVELGKVLDHPHWTFAKKLVDNEVYEV